MFFICKPEFEILCNGDSLEKSVGDIVKYIIQWFQEYKRTLVITSIYLLFGVLWIVITDEIVSELTQSADLIKAFQYYKGLAFIIITTILIFIIVRLDSIKVDASIKKMVESEIKHRKLFDEALDMIVVFEAHSGIIVDCNRQAEILTGRKKEELIGKHEKILHPQSEHAGKFSKSYWEHLIKKSNEVIDSKIVNVAGGLIDVSIKSSKININGNLYLQAIFRDISERNKTEKQLRISESRFRELFENFGSAISIYEIAPLKDDLILVDMNLSAERMGGISKSVAVGNKVRNIYPTFEEAGIIDILLRVWEIGNAEFHPELKIKNEYGTRFFESYVTKIRSEEVVFISHDITSRIMSDKSRKRLESERERLLKFLQVQFSSMPIGLIMTDSELRVLDWNPAAEKIFGYTKEEIINKSLFDYCIPAHNHNYFLDALKHEQELNKTIHIVHENITKDKRKIICEWYNTPVSDREGKILNNMSMVRDVTGTKQKEDEIRRLSLAVEQSPSIVLITDKEANIVYVNKSFTQATGYLSEEVIGKNPRILQSGTMNKEEYKYLWETISSGRVWSGNFLNRKKSGQYYWEQARITAIKDENGQIVNYVAVKEDVTELKAMQEALEESEIRYRTMFDYSSAVMLLISPKDGKIGDANQAAADFYGYDKHTFKGMSITDIYVSLSPQKLESYLTIIKSGVKKYFIFKHKLADGSIRDVEVHSNFILLKGNEMIFSIINDITERKQAEEELERYKRHLEDIVEERTLELLQTEERFRKIAENSHDSIIRFNDSLKIIYANPIVEESLGIKPNDVISKSIEELEFLQEIIDVLKTKLESVFMNKIEERIDFELPNKKWIDWLILPELNKEGNAETVIVFGRDITERKLLEQTILNALDKEKELNELKSRFISTASHEFRTPLSAVLSSAELLQRYGKKWEEKKYNEHILRIRNSVDYLTQLMEDVLTVGRIDSGKLEYIPAWINIEKLCVDVIENIRYSSNTKHNIIFKYEADAKEFFIDEKLFRFIITNVLSNSVKYSSQEEDIDIRICENNKLLEIEIKDRGIGIPEEDIKLMFEPFHRAVNAHEIPGTGLGLFIVKKSVELHSGQIKINSAVGVGTTITITIPVINNLN